MIALEHTYADLPEVFRETVAPSAAVDPRLLLFNAPLAERLGLELGEADDASLAALFSGQVVPEGAVPVAQAYAGHQFGGFVPQLGDGRAVLLGEVVAPDGLRFDLQLKGAGPTRFSRNGDGLNWIGPVLREYIVSEAMHALGVPTTRALAAVATGRPVRRHTALPGAIVTRVASSHIRVGTFEYFAARGDVASLQTLLDYAIRRHDPDLVDADRPAVAFFERVGDRFVRLVAHWMAVGFVHGVMNTDNTAVSGETIDYGPCAFLDTFRFDQVFSSIDRGGRYRYDRQGSLAVWNLAILANALLPLVDADEAQAVETLGPILEGFRDKFDRYWLEAMVPKLGIAEARPSDRALVMQWLQHLQDTEQDFTVAFRTLPARLDEPGDVFDALRARLADQDDDRDAVVARMNAHNPYVIPRNHQIERAIAEGVNGDLTHARRLIDALSDPYTERASALWLTEPPNVDEVVERTFCGT